jgi:hypothetical protein
MNKPKQSLLIAPATYEIRIKGYLEDSWSDRLGGMTILTSKDKAGAMITTLCGQLPDQAALFGVLNALYDMRLPVLSFECLEVN